MKMKKTLRITAKVLGITAGVVVLALVTTSLVNVVANSVEAARIEPYGQSVAVDGKNINVSISGDGDETVVLLPGFGTSSPVLDFAPLVNELEATYRVIVVEPFGYGLSDQTEKERTSANIASEIHEALQQLDVHRYVLMGHSIAGIYALDYVNAYRDEVSAFVGIDTSVPTQPGMDGDLPIDLLKVSRALGISRIIRQFSDDVYAGLPYNESTKDQMRILTHRNSLSDTYVSEMRNIAGNFAAAQELSFPADLPLLLFVQAENVDWWIPLHEEQANSVEHGELVTLDADHYLHHTKSKDIAETFTGFLMSLK